MKDVSMLKGWRTIIFNGLSVLVAGVQMVDPSMFGPQGAAITALVVTIGNLVLRSITTTAVGKAE